MTDSCPICATSATIEDPSMEVFRVKCYRCGSFDISRNSVDDLPAHAKSWKRTWPAQLSFALRKMQTGDRIPVLGSVREIEGIIASTQLPAPHGKGDNLILWMGSELLDDPSDYVQRQGPSVLEITARTGCFDDGDVFYVAKELEDLGFLESHHAKSVFRAHLTFRGWERYDQLQRETVDSRLAFMAMPYGDETLDRVFNECFSPAVGHTGFDLRRLDAAPEAGLIDNRLRVEIRRSRFLVAELTNDNSGAYWEAGFAEGIGRPVIYTCEKRYFDKNRTHFDAQHSATIIWSEGDFAAAAEELKATIRNTLPAEANLADPA